ncbi:MAG TPA: nucleoside triphosphate pyrophosphohydrolase family protein [Patescibacteria group bacterium]|jgi:NTP pyrophosphatase (non-canonical NTP hydrolase)|nr:nucleoside triphosphate pyrophosphohydrolase family protein [Patescibacteria group bacterium]
MTFDEYQAQALTTVISNPDPLMNKTIWAMGVAGEAGEVIEKWKKIVAYKNGRISDQELAELGKELGDVLWYVAVFADSLGLSLDSIAKQNGDKLASRKDRGVTKGAGDNR